MRKAGQKILNVFGLLIVLIIVSFIIFLSIDNYNKKNQTRYSQQPEANLILAPSDTSTKIPIRVSEDQDVYKQRQLRADETAKTNKTYRVGGAQITTEEGFTVATTFHNLGNVVKAHYGYTDYFTSPVSNGIYADTVFTLENRTKTPLFLNINTIHFVDQFGRSFLPIKQEGTCGVQDVDYPTSNDAITGNLNPNVPCTVRILFEVATSSTPQYIEFLTN
ncbi:MAG: hypothetical protein QG653_59 [Patescibacteria group bacterium]|nr:hypothetical protein [Patescibacteria group bacterium]